MGPLWSFNLFDPAEKSKVGPQCFRLWEAYSEAHEEYVKADKVKTAEVKLLEAEYEELLTKHCTPQTREWWGRYVPALHEGPDPSDVEVDAKEAKRKKEFFEILQYGAKVERVEVGKWVDTFEEYVRRFDRQGEGERPAADSSRKTATSGVPGTQTGNTHPLIPLRGPFVWPQLPSHLQHPWEKLRHPSPLGAHPHQSTVHNPLDESSAPFRNLENPAEGQRPLPDFRLANQTPSDDHPHPRAASASLRLRTLWSQHQDDGTEVSRPASSADTLFDLRLRSNAFANRLPRRTVTSGPVYQRRMADVPPRSGLGPEVSSEDSSDEETEEPIEETESPRKEDTDNRSRDEDRGGLVREDPAE